jgi:anthranilate phosphoribosyltransferase
VARFRDGEVENFQIEPEDFGIWRSGIDSIRGGHKEENAAITLSVLRGEKGPKRDIILMNSAVALIAAGKSTDFKTAFSIAADSIDSGMALKKLDEVRKVSNAL